MSLINVKEIDRSAQFPALKETILQLMKEGYRFRCRFSGGTVKGKVRIFTAANYYVQYVDTPEKFYDLLAGDMYGRPIGYQLEKPESAKVEKGGFKLLDDEVMELVEKAPAEVLQVIRENVLAVLAEYEVNKKVLEPEKLTKVTDVLPPDGANDPDKTPDPQKTEAELLKEKREADFKTADEMFTVPQLKEELEKLGVTDIPNDARKPTLIDMYLDASEQKAK